MKRLLFSLGALYTIAFLFAWFVYPELSVLPLGGLTAIGMCYLFYIIDKRGFNEIDTIENLRQSPWLYYAHLGMYAGLILAGHILAWYALR